MAPQLSQPGGKTILAAVTTVAAVYVYFLIFAQFGFLQVVQAVLGQEPGVLRPLMAAMGLAGVAASVLAARVFREERSRRWLAVGFGFCGVAAAWSLVARWPAEFQGVAVLTGCGVGLTTVTLVGLLRRSVGEARLGLIIGVGTGLAYAFCNLPAVFAAEAEVQARLAVLAALVGLAASRGLVPRFAVNQSTGVDYSRGGAIGWVAVLLVFVCLDSAAFYIIQHTASLKESTWGEETQLAVNAGAHLVAGLFAGAALDRGRLGLVTLAAISLLAIAVALIAAGHGPVGAPLYAAGVSGYSTALVFYPARRGSPWLAALVYAMAGWVGSGLGIAAAEGRHELPNGLVIAPGVAMAAGLFWRNTRLRRET